MKTLPTVALAGAVMLAPQLQAGTFTFITFAGNAGIGTGDGLASAARFQYPTSGTLDSAGNIYVADYQNNTIRKITPAGVVSTLAGSAGVVGSVDGTGSAARFNAPTGVAVDRAGNVYVADAGNNTIRKITPAGVVSTFAGSAGVSGSADGTGSAALFNYPYNLTVDTSGNAYVADSYNHTVRRITPSGTVSTVAGLAGVSGSTDGTGTTARFNTPAGVALDSSGNVFVADLFNNTIRKITPTGIVSTFAGLAGAPGSADGTGSAARFNGPIGPAVDSAGNVYVADFSNNTIRQITPAAMVSTLAGTAGVAGSTDGTGSTARFYVPNSVAVDGAGNLYVIDNGNCTVRKISPIHAVSTIAGRAGGAGNVDGTGSSALLNGPNNVAVDKAGNVYVADETGNTIRKITPDRVVSTFAGLGGVPGSLNGTGSAARFNRPEGVAVGASGNVFVADQNNHTIRKITPAGAVSTLAGLAGTPGSTDGTGSAARFNQPSSVAADALGNVFVADFGNNTIRKITSARVVTTIAGLAGAAGSTDGTGSAARFYAPYGVALDSAGNLYVADAGNNTIRKITPTRVVSTLAGQVGTPGSADGIGSQAQFNSPNSLVVDAATNIYVADSSNYTLRKITPAGQVSTIGGLAGVVGVTDGTATAARFYYPYGITVDSVGNLYVADWGNNIIRKGIPTTAVPRVLLSSPTSGTDAFSFGMTGLAGMTVNVEASVDLTEWQFLSGYVLDGGTNYFQGPEQFSAIQFYRAHSP